MESTTNSLHESHMRHCLRLAGIARERGEVPVGSIVVRDGLVIAEGIESVKANLDIVRHAEMEAIRRACETLQTLDLSGCTLYTSAEPCLMCSYAIRACKISAVVFGESNTTIGGFSSEFQILSTNNVPHWEIPPAAVTHVLREVCASIRSGG
jgi:tRNA(adenine34) deaminase